VRAPEGYEDLFDDTTKSFLALATVRASGSPVVVPVWFVTDETGLVFTTDDDAFKAKDMRARPSVAGMVMAEGEHARYVSVRGTASDVSDTFTPDTAESLHRRIVQRYEGRDPTAPFEGAIFRLVPERMSGYDYRDFKS
jgi:PPOX class probable F420-dependent enzyme